MKENETMLMLSTEAKVLARQVLDEMVILKIKMENDIITAKETNEDKILSTLLRIEQLLIKQMATKEIKSNG